MAVEILNSSKVTAVRRAVSRKTDRKTMKKRIRA